MRRLYVEFWRKTETSYIREMNVPLPSFFTIDSKVCRCFFTGESTTIGLKYKQPSMSHCVRMTSLSLVHSWPLCVIPEFRPDFFFLFAHPYDTGCEVRAPYLIISFRPVARISFIWHSVFPMVFVFMQTELTWAWGREQKSRKFFFVRRAIVFTR